MSYENIKQIAILPEPIPNFGIGSRLYTTRTAYLIEQTPTHFLSQMYKSRGKNKKEVDQIIKNTLQISKNLPYIVDTSHVFFGFKYRKGLYDRENRGFVNVAFVEAIDQNTIILNTGESIATLNTFETLNTNKNNAKALLYREQLISSVDWLSTMDIIRESVMRETMPKATKFQQNPLD